MWKGTTQGIHARKQGRLGVILESDNHSRHVFNIQMDERMNEVTSSGPYLKALSDQRAQMHSLSEGSLGYSKGIPRHRLGPQTVLQRSSYTLFFHSLDRRTLSFLWNTDSTREDGVVDSRSHKRSDNPGVDSVFSLRITSVSFR